MDATPLDRAIATGTIAQVRRLLAQRDCAPNTRQLVAACNQKRWDIVEAILDSPRLDPAGMAPVQINGVYGTAVAVVVWSGRRDLAHKLMTHPNFTDPYGRNELTSFAIHQGKIDIVRYMCETYGIGASASYDMLLNAAASSDPAIFDIVAECTGCNALAATQCAWTIQK